MSQTLKPNLTPEPWPTSNQLFEVHSFLKFSIQKWILNLLVPQTDGHILTQGQ